MRKILLWSCFCLLVLSACRKDNDPAPGERPEERLSKALAEYKSLLTGAPYGWKATLYPQGGGGYNFYFNFSENDRVVMTSDINQATATAMESTYRLKTMQRPSLIFDTYSHLHILSDPDATISGGDWGAGKSSDFEFAFTSASADQITLQGNFRKSQLVLTRATQQEAENFIATTRAAAAVLENINAFSTYFKRLTLGTTALDVQFNLNDRSVTFFYFEGGTLRSFTTSFNYTPAGIQLKEPFAAAGVTITALNNLEFNAGSKRFTFTIDNAAATLQEAARPVQLEAGIARTFYNIGAQYWGSFGGFTVEGVEDAYKLTELQNFYFLSYWPKYDSFNNTVYDLLGLVFFDPATQSPTIESGAFMLPSFTSDGRIVFTLLQQFNDDAVPPAYLAALTATVQKWTDSQGFYVIKVGDSAYDLVSARDAKAWVRLSR